MVLRLFLFVLLYALPVLATGAAVYHGGKKLLGKRLAERRQKRLGERRAIKLLKAPNLDTCCLYDKPVDKAADLYDRKIGWFHFTCHNALVGGREETP